MTSNPPVFHKEIQENLNREFSSLSDVSWSVSHSPLNY